MFGQIQPCLLLVTADGDREASTARHASHARSVLDSQGARACARGGLQPAVQGLRGGLSPEGAPCKALYRFTSNSTDHCINAEHMLRWLSVVGAA